MSSSGGASSGYEDTYVAAYADTYADTYVAADADTYAATYAAAYADTCIKYLQRLCR